MGEAGTLSNRKLVRHNLPRKGMVESDVVTGHLASTLTQKLTYLQGKCGKIYSGFPSSSTGGGRAATGRECILTWPAAVFSPLSPLGPISSYQQGGKAQAP